MNDPPKGATELVGPSLEGPPEGPALSVAATVRVCVVEDLEQVVGSYSAVVVWVSILVLLESADQPD